MQVDGFGVELGEEFKQDADMTRSDKFAQRVVSLGPHNYIERAEGLSSEKKKSN